MEKTLTIRLADDNCSKLVSNQFQTWKRHAINNDEQYMRKTGACVYKMVLKKKHVFKHLNLNVCYNWIVVPLLRLKG